MAGVVFAIPQTVWQSGPLSLGQKLPFTPAVATRELPVRMRVMNTACPRWSVDLRTTDDRQKLPVASDPGTNGMRKVILGFLCLVLMMAGCRASNLLSNAEADSAQTIEDLGPVYCMAVSQDGERVVSGHQDSRARVWNLKSGELLAQFGDQRPAVVCAAFSPDGKQIAFAHADEFVRIWDLELGREITTFRGHSGTVLTVAYMPDGKQILSTAGDKTIRLWDVASGAEMRRFVGHDADINSVLPFADGRTLISASGDYWGGRVNDSSVRLWDVATGKELKKFVGECGPMGDMALSTNDQFAVTCSWRKGIQVWNVTDGTEIRRFGDTYTNCIALSPNNRQVVSGGYKGDIKVWDVDTGELLLQLPGHASEIHGIAFSPDGTHVISCSGHWGSRGNEAKTDFLGMEYAEAVDCTTRLWSIKESKEVRRFNGPVNP